MKQYLEHARKNMIEGQIRPNGVTDESVVDVMRYIPREEFLPEAVKAMAYSDEDVPVGGDRYMLKPVVLARLLQSLVVNRNDIVLNIGCGTGYSSVILGAMARTVWGIERDRKMIAEGTRLVEGIGVGDIHFVQQDDLAAGYAEKAPYDVILFNGAVASIPQKIKSQLSDGGSLAAVVCRKGQMGVATLVTRQGNDYSTRTLFDTAAPFLAGFEPSKAFVF